MSLTTPDKIRSLQRKLYCKAKAEPTFRFYLLYDKIYREDILFHAYRPARGAVDAVKEVHRRLCRGYADVVDADLSQYFDTIPHSELIKSVARRVVDRNVLHLIKMWLRAPIEERDADGIRRMSGG